MANYGYRKVPPLRFPVREALSSRLRLLELFSRSIRLLGLRRSPAALPRGHIDSSGIPGGIAYTDCRKKQT